MLTVNDYLTLPIIELQKHEDYDKIIAFWVAKLLMVNPTVFFGNSIVQELIENN